ncbi:Clavaminate synthase-like protein [Pterulicium gracile]|uniref:Clavaminate synthase-like protein n=1 Tax=Pterulicium gracile TaxID=1884261 RepID=A0A5C3QC82_9AGAR|nr:Clavaminate synthase-like protein [Pterula gracilis]
MSANTAHTVPPFPADVPSHLLSIIDYRKLKDGDGLELDKLWMAATRHGFWYLVNHGSVTEAADMFQLTSETMALPLEEKLMYEQGDNGKSFGYKAKGAYVTDSAGNVDNVEFFNVAIDDALSFPHVTHKRYPPVVNGRMEPTVRPFVIKTSEICKTLLEAFEGRLGLPDSSLCRLHFANETSSGEARCTYSVVRPPLDSHSQNRVSLLAHTDFGSLTVLHNHRVGGLQVLLPGSDEWKYIQPLPGHLICNIGDALSIFSGGILQSSLHRVVSPPGEQLTCERISVAMFLRPSRSVILRALVESSDTIALAVNKHRRQGGTMDFDTGSTMSEWHARRLKNHRINNVKRQGPNTWLAGKGTEHSKLACTA